MGAYLSLRKFLCLFILLSFTLININGCGKSQEKIEVDHFKKAQNGKLYLDASRYLKKITEGSSIVGSMKQDDLNAFVEKLSEALGEAKLVSDDVLRKIHPDLPWAYHSIFIPCIENQIRGFRDFDVMASIEGQSLHNVWIDWWNGHYKQFSI